jgi:cell division transport system permease protein
MFTALRRIIRYGLQSFSRDGEIVAATVFILFLSITLVSSLFLFRDISKVLIAKVEEKIDVSVYFKEGIEETDILKIRQQLAAFPEVKSVEYVSQDEALQEFTDRHEGESLLMESIDELGRNPFLASLNIKAWDPTQYGKLSDFLDNPDFSGAIEKVDYFQRKTVIDKMNSVNSMISRIGVVVAVILVGVAVAVTYNTIRLSIYNSRKEIKVQKLVGASNWFIRGPFLAQGAICGILATAISFLLMAAIFWVLSPKIENFFTDLDIFALFQSNLWAILLTQLATGIFLGMVSSAIAVRKYLED